MKSDYLMTKRLYILLYIEIQHITSPYDFFKEKLKNELINGINHFTNTIKKKKRKNFYKTICDTLKLKSTASRNLTMGSDSLLK